MNNNADDAHKKNDHSPPSSHPAPVPNKNMIPQSEPGYGAAVGNQHAVLPEVYSTAPGDEQHRAARAEGVAANHVEDQQALHHGNSGNKNKQRIDEAAKLVAEENASRSKFPRYAGLERWELLEKMGDGAFSNVYRARDLEGDTGEVAIKVVRKYEMNSMQVSSSNTTAVCILRPSQAGRPFPLSPFTLMSRDFPFTLFLFANVEGCLGPKTSPSGL